MPRMGRPRLTPEEYEARLRAYCSRYDVQPSAKGLPPFPTGRRETPQHRAWMSLYKAHQRLAGGGGDAALEDRRGLHAAQRGKCPLCGRKVDVSGAIDRQPSGEPRGLLHEDCRRMVGLVEAAGPETLERLRAYLLAGATRG